LGDLLFSAVSPTFFSRPARAHLGFFTTPRPEPARADSCFPAVITSRAFSIGNQTLVAAM